MAPVKFLQIIVYFSAFGCILGNSFGLSGWYRIANFPANTHTHTYIYIYSWKVWYVYLYKYYLGLSRKRNKDTRNDTVLLHSMGITEMELGNKDLDIISWKFSIYLLHSDISVVNWFIHYGLLMTFRSTLTLWWLVACKTPILPWTIADLLTRRNYLVNIMFIFWLKCQFDISHKI